MVSVNNSSLEELQNQKFAKLKLRLALVLIKITIHPPARECIIQAQISTLKQSEGLSIIIFPT